MQKVYELLKDDPEAAHSRADDILRAALRDTGFSKLITIYDKIEKWYA